MNKNKRNIEPTQLASLSATLMSTTSLFATILALISPKILTLTPFLNNLYGSLGYSVSLMGAILGAFYIGIDTFILTYLFAWIYNKLL